jgi:hypothetical protein
MAGSLTGLSLPSGDRHFVVRAADEKAFRLALRKLGIGVQAVDGGPAPI